MPQLTYSENLKQLASSPYSPTDGEMPEKTSAFDPNLAGSLTGGDSAKPKSLGRYVFSRAAKELFIEGRPLAEAQIKRALNFQPVFDANLSKYLTMATADYKAGQITKFSRTATETANQQARQAQLTNTALGLSDAVTAGMSEKFQEDAAMKTLDFEQHLYDPQYNMQQLLPVLGLLNDLMNPNFDWASQLHGLTQDLNPQARNSNTGIGGILGTLAGDFAFNVPVK